MRKSPHYDGKGACCNRVSTPLGFRKVLNLVYLPAVLSTNMSINAKTCNDKLYVPLLPVEPHTGFRGVFCLRASSACKMSVEISSHDVDAVRKIRMRLSYY